MARLIAKYSLAALLILAPWAKAQQENTIEDWSWQVDHFERFGIWDSVCDFRNDGTRELKRCYVSYVDVFAPRPKFAAAFMFVTPVKGSGVNFEFRFERGTRFDPGGFAIVSENEVLWQYDTARCPTLKCVISGEEADELALVMNEPAALRFAIIDRFGRFWELNWDTTGFAEALADMLDGAQARQLF